LTTFGDTVYHRGGEPVGGPRYTSIWGTHYFIDNDDGSDAYDGKSPGRAFKTLTYAVTKAGTNDVIYVKAADTLSELRPTITEGAQVTIPYASANLSIIGVTAHRRNAYMGVWFQHGATDGDTG
jgi:hypothetical protein